MTSRMHFNTSPPVETVVQGYTSTISHSNTSPVDTVVPGYTSEASHSNTSPIDTVVVGNTSTTLSHAIASAVGAHPTAMGDGQLSPMSSLGAKSGTIDEVRIDCRPWSALAVRLCARVQAGPCVRL